MRYDDSGFSEPKEQSKDQTKASARQPAAPRRRRGRADDGSSSSGPSFVQRLTGGVSSIWRDPSRRWIGRFALAFGVAGFASFFLITALALGFAGGFKDRVVPGVHVGGVDLSGTSRDEAMASLKSAYSYLSQGEVSITTPFGVSAVSYEEVGRGPDVEAMADAALAIGHSGNPVVDAAAVMRAAGGGQNLPVIVQLNSVLLAKRVHQVVGQSSVAARDAQALYKDNAFTVSSSATGRGIDEAAMARSIFNQLSSPDAPADVAVGGDFTTIEPKVTEADAQDAIQRAKKMVVDVTVTWGPNSWTINSADIGSWIVFGTRSDGSYAPAVDAVQLTAFLSGEPSKLNQPAIEPKVVWDAKTGVPTGLLPGTDGIGVDINGTTHKLETYLDSLADGGSPVSSIEVMLTPIHSQMTTDSLTGLVNIGEWTTIFFPGPSNGGGANIRKPAEIINGVVIGPGQEFSFLREVGPVDEAHGFAKGGVIIGGVQDHTGAMGGGICSASTTFFNAAARAGLQINERHAHLYYINRYPVGLDATVFSNGSSNWDMRWTNDTDNAIVVRSWATHKYGQNSITVQLWSLPLNRTVTFNDVPSTSIKGPPGPGKKTNMVTPRTPTVRYNDPSLKPGQTNWDTIPDDGFATSVTRKVYDADKNLLHQDTWLSVYKVDNGLILVGGPPATPTPLGTPTPTPAPATPTPTPTPTPAVTPKRKPEEAAA
jgi:vancomycin resistance protein YoaR